MRRYETVLVFAHIFSVFSGLVFTNKRVMRQNRSYKNYDLEICVQFRRAYCYSLAKIKEIAYASGEIATIT